VGVVDEAVAALAGRQAVILPTDTVYGLCAAPDDERAIGRLYALKQRPGSDPVALLAAELAALFSAVPELDDVARAVASALLPGPYTLVLSNPARRFPSVTGSRPDTIGVRVPDLPGDARAIVERVGVVAATSANRHGGPDPRTVDEVPREIRDRCGSIVDAGPLPGTPSTVLDLTGPEPRVIREGAVAAADALAQAREAAR